MTGDPLKCVWMLAGVVDYKLCDRQYDCEHCPLDSALRERAPSHGHRIDTFLCSSISHQSDLNGSQLAADRSGGR
jgi:hypothetical protein